MAQRLPVLVDAGRLGRRVRLLAERIARDYRDRRLLLVGILRGAYPFARDLSARLDVPHELDFLSVASYRGTRSSGSLQLRKWLDRPVRGRDVLVVEDIVETGRTLEWVLGRLAAEGPRSLATCCLLAKPARLAASVWPDYVGFAVDDRFVVGYGLDYRERYRDLPFLSWVTPGRVLV